jgi:hypothetical protein
VTEKGLPSISSYPYLLRGRTKAAAENRNAPMGGGIAIRLMDNRPAALRAALDAKPAHPRRSRRFPS